MSNKLQALMLLPLFYSSLIFANENVELTPLSVISHYDNAVGTSNAASEGLVRSDLIK